MHGEVGQPGTVAPGHGRYESDLPDRPDDLESYRLASIPLVVAEESVIGCIASQASVSGIVP